MKHYSLILFVFLSLNVSAQNARKILDATSERLTAEGGLQFTFKAMQFKGNVPDAGAQGTMMTDGTKYHIETEEMLVWYDGETLWSMQKESNEVNLSTPTNEEKAAMNIGMLMNIYKQGYKLSAKKSSLRSRVTYEVHLLAKNKKQGFEEIYIDVDQQTKFPLCFRTKKDGNWTRLSVFDLTTHHKHNTSAFIFPKEKYPNVEVIDLR